MLYRSVLHAVVSIPGQITVLLKWELMQQVHLRRGQVQLMSVCLLCAGSAVGGCGTVGRHQPCECAQCLHLAGDAAGGRAGDEVVHVPVRWLDWPAPVCLAGMLSGCRRWVARRVKCVL